MRKSRFTETQIVSILREHDAGSTFVELGRKHAFIRTRLQRGKRSSAIWMQANSLDRARSKTKIHECDASFRT
jgi:hypothetical protein